MPSKIVSYFIRHGETDLNKKDEFRGDADVPLNEEGERQAQALVPIFRHRQFSAAFHSGMRRTAQTLEPLMQDKGMESTKIDDMNSLNTGDFTGLPKTEENKKKLEWYRQHPDEVIPGGERVQDFRDRIDPKIMMAIRIGEDAGLPTISAVHGSVMRELSRLFNNGDYNKVKVDPGGVVGVFKTPNGYETKPLIRENDGEEDIQPGS
jgi:broad specificity phosphatase PhoE